MRKQRRKTDSFLHASRPLGTIQVKEPPSDDFSKPRNVQYHSEWKTTQDDSGRQVWCRNCIQFCASRLHLQGDFSKRRTNFTLETLDATTRTEDCTQKFLANAAAARHFLKCIFSHPETGVQRGKRAERGSRQLDRRPRDIPLQETGSARSPCNSGLFKVTSSIVITMSLDVNSTCRKDYHSQFHWNTVMWPGLLAQHWTCCKKIEKMNIGMWSRIEVYQILWQDSQRSHCWKGNLPKDICGPERDWRKFHRCCTSLRITKPWLKWS